MTSISFLSIAYLIKVSRSLEEKVLLLNNSLIKAVRNRDVEQVEKLSQIFPEFMDEQYFECQHDEWRYHETFKNLTAVQFWIRNRDSSTVVGKSYDEDVAGMTDDYGYRFEKPQGLDPFIDFLLSKNPKECVSTPLLSRVLIMRENDQLVFSVLKVVATLPIDQQRLALGERINHANILEFARVAYPKFLPDLLALPRLEESDVLIDQFSVLNYAILNKNHKLLKNLLRPGRALNTLADNRNPIQLAREQAPECLPALLEHLLMRPLKEQEELLSPQANTVLTYVYDHHRPLLSSFKAIQSQLCEEQQRQLDDLLKKSQLQKKLFALISSPRDERALEKMLEDKAVDVQMKDEQGFTLIQHATWNKDSALVNFLSSHQADMNQAADIICSKDLSYLELFSQCSETFEHSIKLRMINYFKAQWLAVLTIKKDAKDMERILSVFPAWLHAKAFEGHKTALEYLMQERSESSKIKAYWREKSYQPVNLDKLIVLLLSKNPRVCDSGELIDAVAKLVEPEELMFTVLKIVVCLPLEQQGRALGTFFPRYATILEFTQDQYPQFLHTLEAVPGAQLPAVRVDKNLQLLEAIEQSNLEAAQKLIEAGADVNRVGQDNAYPLQQAVHKGDKAMMGLLLKNKASFKSPEGKKENIVEFAVKKSTMPRAFAGDI